MVDRDVPNSQVDLLRATLCKMEIALGTVEDCIVWTNARGQIKWCNAPFEKLLGRPRLFLLGTQLCESLPLWESGVAIAASEHPVNLALTTQKPGKQDYEFQQGDGVLTLEIARSFVAIDASLSTDDASSAVIVVRDVTQQRQHERQQRKIKEILEDKVSRRTQELQRANQKLQEETTHLKQLLEELKQTQSQLFHAEKMSSLGQLVAGVAHEINNPVNFIHGNLEYLKEYAEDLLELVETYQEAYPNPLDSVREKIDDIDLDFLQEDLPKLVTSMKVGADRIHHIVLSLRNFSRMDEATSKVVDVHEGIESTLLILQHRLKAIPMRGEIEVKRDYGELPRIECFPGELNQVLMNIMANAIDTIEERCIRMAEASQPHLGCLSIGTAIEGEFAIVRIADNGEGMPDRVRQQIFNPFFTTKPIGKGTGLGMSISYQIIVEKHGGTLECTSQVGEGSEFAIRIPIAHPPD